MIDKHIGSDRVLDDDITCVYEEIPVVFDKEVVIKGMMEERKQKNE